MILKFNEFINKQSKPNDKIEIHQGDDLTSHVWDESSINPKAFDSIFQIDEISNCTLNRISGKSYPEGCKVAVSDLRYLIIPHYDGKGYVKIGELICNKEVADEFIFLFKELFKQKYSIERMELVDNYDADDQKSMEANNTSAFNYRTISGSDKLSRHALGMAIDINPLYNPCVRGDKVSPATGEPFVDRNKSFKYKLDSNDSVYRILHNKFGFTWGGDWQSCKDYQHYEK